MNSSSFFRLPLIFIAIYAVINITWDLVNSFLLYSDYSYADMFPGIIVAQLIAYFFPLCLYFLIAIFQCQKYKLHTTENQNLFNIIIIAIIFSAFSIGFNYLISFAIQPIYEYLYQVNNMYQFIVLFGYIRMILSYIIEVIILLLLFKLIAGGHVAQRQSYVFDAVLGKKVYAAVFSLILLILGMLWTSLNAFSTIFDLHYSLGESMAIFFMLPVVILTSLFNYWFVYASTRNCFHAVPTSLKMMPLVKSIALTILFIIIGSIVLGIVLGIISVALLSSSGYYYGSIPPSFIILIIIAFVLVYWLVYLATRTAVKIIFKQTINNQSTTPPTSTILEDTF